MQSVLHNMIIIIIMLVRDLGLLSILFFQKITLLTRCCKILISYFGAALRWRPRQRPK